MTLLLAYLSCIFIPICDSQWVSDIAYGSDNEIMSKKAPKLHRGLVSEKRSGSRKKQVPTTSRMSAELHISYAVERPEEPRRGTFLSPKMVICHLGSKSLSSARP